MRDENSKIGYIQFAVNFAKYDIDQCTIIAPDVDGIRVLNSTSHSLLYGNVVNIFNFVDLGVSPWKVFQEVMRTLLPQQLK